MKKCIIISAFYQNILTSRPRLIYEFMESRYETTVVTADFVHSTKKYDKTKESYIDKVHVPKYSKNFSIGRIFSHFVFAIKVVLYLYVNKSDLVYICLPPNFSSWVSSILAKKSGSSVIVDVIDIWPNYNEKSKGLIGSFYKIWGSFRDKAISNSNYVILECNLYKKLLNKNLKCSSCVIPLAKKENNKITLFTNKIDNNILYVGYIGAFSHSYDFDSLIKILSNIKTKKIHVEIIGFGELKSVVLEKLKINGIPYTDYGIVYEEDLKRDILSRCHFGFNGFKDNAIVGLSYKSIDYLSFGVPLLNNLKEDTWDIVNDLKVGFNYCSNDILKVVKLIDQIDFEELQEMKKKSRLAFENNYSWKAFVNSMQCVLNKLENNCEEQFDDNF